MFPKIKFKYDKPYAELLFNLGPHKHENFEKRWQEVLKKGNKLEKLFSQHKKKVLRLILQYSGYSWREYADNPIYVYLVDGFPSFASPLTLHVQDGPTLSLGILIHELAHNNMYFEFPNEEIKENLMCQISLNILKDLGVNSRNVEKFFDQVFQKRFSQKRKKLNLTKSAKEIISELYPDRIPA